MDKKSYINQKVLQKSKSVAEIKKCCRNQTTLGERHE
jgi:hypothetical protein